MTRQCMHTYIHQNQQKKKHKPIDANENQKSRNKSVEIHFDEEEGVERREKYLNPMQIRDEKMMEEGFISFA